MEITHVAYSDESKHNQGRYRSISLVSLIKKVQDHLNKELTNSLDRSGLVGKELKWVKIRDAKYTFAALDFLQIIYPLVLEESIRIDTLIWDTYDSRHSILSRDDKRNFSIMYYRQLFDCMQKRWPPRSLWGFYPDKTSQIDWNELLQIMENSAYTLLGQSRELPTLSKSRYSYCIVDFEQKNSINEPLVQLADLFAGIGEFSCNEFKELNFEIQNNRGQPPLLNFGIKSSNSVKFRAKVIEDLLQFCRKNKMCISFQKTNGLKSNDPRKPINFWRYTPQHPQDKAPIKN